MAAKLTQAIAVARMKEVMPQFDFSIFIYSGAAKKGTVICQTHGEFQTTYDSIVGGHGCPGCKADKVSERHTLSYGTAVAKMMAKSPQYDYSKFKYIGSDTSGTVICLSHGEFTTSYDYIVSGRGCPKCKAAKTSQRCRLNGDVALQRMIRCTPQYDYSSFEYKTSGSKGTVVCKTHGPFQTSYNFIVNGTGCPDCSVGGFNLKRRAVFYIYKITRDDKHHLGYGITGSIGKRNADHQTNFNSHGYVGNLMNVLRFRRGYVCKAVESLVQASFKPVDLGIPGFRREATKWENYQMILAIASTLQERFGSLDELDAVLEI
jgi:rubredoxin